MTARMGLDYIVLRCTDLERSRIFYRALGLDLVPERHGSGVLHYSSNLGGVILELYPTSVKQTSNVRLGLRLSNVRDAIDAMTSIGADFLRVEPGGSSAVVRDPDGHEIALLSALAGTAM